MTTLAWDEIGERIYEAGVDRGVLYLSDGRAVPWNGIVSVEESSTAELKPYYLDGNKYMETLVPGDFAGKLRAFTYPDEFEEVSGVTHVAPGFRFHDQPSKRFSLSYRTKIGDDIQGLALGYKIHILYNVVAKPDARLYRTLNQSPESIEFGWDLSGVPPTVGRFKPPVHITIDSREVGSDILEIIENVLYGTPTSSPSLPTIQDIAEYFGYLGALIIVDHGDGSWTAIDEGGDYIDMLDATTFQIDNANANYLDSDTYQVSSTNVNNPL